MTTIRIAGIVIGSLSAALVTSLAAPSARAQTLSARFEVDLGYPKPLPNKWVTGGIGGHCIDADDHVLLLNRQDVLEGDLNAGRLAPLMIELDTGGKVVHSWGDPNQIEGAVAGFRLGAVSNRLHTCQFDKDNNVWIASSPSGMIQKYSHDGSRLIQQIGKRGEFDSADGTSKG